MQENRKRAPEVLLTGINRQGKFWSSLQRVCTYPAFDKFCGLYTEVLHSKDMVSAAVVAVKIIDIDESDTLNPRLADTYSEFMKEVNTLKILSDNKARNINHVIEALPVGKAMWMIIEYCAGGSIATLVSSTTSARDIMH